MGKDYAVELWQEYHSAAALTHDYKSRVFVLNISTSDLALCRDTFREAGTEVTRATISEDGVRIVISSPA